ncbi:MAG TPA: 23S rRNA (adenine(2503)-C(2))-methyltransferase RlmN [Patescibacteria group bacterium]|nr:23S rRNA (adenine(2503)-C(2))-methyltransferase RlmN [Patescibacteria group bacterium]
MKKELFGLFSHEIAAAVAELGIEKYRGKQIAQWLYQRQTFDFQQMTDLSLKQRQLLEQHFTAYQVNAAARQHSADGCTSKYLLELSDGLSVETVLMRQPYGASVCVSTQVGCGMGCIFCASNLHGMTRNLTGGEILSQVLFVAGELAAAEPEGKGIHSIVIMGSGEPLANYEQVLRFIRLLHEPYCLNLSYRSITLSTSGLEPAMQRLAGEGLPITLSISLHAPNNEIRSRLMPINNTYPLETVLQAGDAYAAATGRRVTYEYTLIAGINDQPEHARELARLLKKRLANVNLIPVNPVPERGLFRPEPTRVKSFGQILEAGGINATIRREMGADIDAACGQLRKRVMEAKQTHD